MSETYAAGQSRHRPSPADGRFRHRAAGPSGRSTTSPNVIAESADEFDKSFRIRVADDPTRRSTASALVERRYAWRGYSSAPAPLAHEVGHRLTFSACSDDTTIATITAALDADDGLYVGRLYPEEVQALRDEGRKLCEFTKLAVDESVRSPAVLGAIFHVACLYVIELQRCTDVLIEVNPRHVRFYERMLGFTRAADERLDPEVNAPAVLLRLDLKHCAAEIARLGGRRGAHKGRSFYPFFFAPDAADKIVQRLRVQ